MEVGGIKYCQVILHPGMYIILKHKTYEIHFKSPSPSHQQIETKEGKGVLTLPDAEAHLQILPSPSVHQFIVGAHFPEVLAVHGKQPSGHGG